MKVIGHPVSFEIKKNEPDCRTCKNLYLGHKCTSTEQCDAGSKYEAREPLHLWKNDVHL